MIGFYHIKDGMSVCYNKLWKLLIDKNMNKTDLRLAAGITTTALAKLGKSENVNTEVLTKICKVLGCGVDGCDCEETLKLIAEGKLDTEPLITHTYPLAKIDEAYDLFENKRDGVIKVALEC